MNEQQLASAGSAFSSLLGNIILGATTPDAIKAPRVRSGSVSPVDIDMSNERRQAEKDAALSRRIASENIQNQGGSSGATMASLGYAGAANLNALNDMLGRINSQENQMDARSQEQANRTNASMKSRDAVTNARLNEQNINRELQRLKDIQQYYGAAASVIPQMMREWNQIANQNKLIGAMGRNYKYDKNGNIILR